MPQAIQSNALNTKEVLSPSEAGRVNLDRSNLEKGNLPLESRIKKVMEDKNSVAQNLETLGNGLINAPVWNESESVAVNSIFSEIHKNYYEYVHVIDGILEQSRELLSSGENEISAGSESHLLEVYSKLNEKLFSYQIQMKNLATSLALLQEKLPSATVGETARKQYEDLVRQTLSAVNGFVREGILSVGKEKNETLAGAKEHNRLINFIYNSYDLNTELKPLAEDYTDLTRNSESIQESVNKGNLEDLSDLLKENALDLPPSVRELFLVKNYFDLQPGLAEKLENKIQYIESTKNQLVAQYGSEAEQRYLKEKIGEPASYDALNLRRLMRETIIKSPKAVLSALQEKQNTLTALRELGKTDVMEVKPEEAAPEAPSATIEIDKGLLKEDEAVANVEKDFMTRAAREDLRNQALADQLAKQAEKQALSKDEIPKAEYESRFWQKVPELKDLYDTYLVDLRTLAEAQDDDLKDKLNQVAVTVENHFKNYILDNYATFDLFKMRQELEKYLADQRVAFEELKENLDNELMHKESAVSDEAVEEGVIKLDDSELVDISDEAIANKFWEAHPELERKMERYSEFLMRIKDRILAKNPQMKISDWTGEVLADIENHIKNNQESKDEEGVVAWIDSYLERRLAEARGLEFNTNPVAETEMPLTAESSVDDLLDDFFSKYPDLETKMEQLSNSLMKIRERIEKIDPIYKQSDWTSNVLIQIKDYFSDNYLKQSEEQLKTWFNKYLEEQLENLRALEIIIKKEAEGIVLTEKDIEYVDESAADVEKTEKAQAASALASFEKIVPADELDFSAEKTAVKQTGFSARVKGLLGKFFVKKEKPTLPKESAPISPELQKDLDKLFEAPKKTEKLQPEIVPSSAIGNIKLEKKVDVPVVAEASIELEKTFEMQQLLAIDNNLKNWAKEYLQILGYDQVDLADLKEADLAILNDAVFLYQKLENWSLNSYLMDLKVTFEQLTLEEQKKETATLFREKNKGALTLRADVYLNLINKYIQLLNNRVKTDIARRDYWKGNKKAA